MYMMGVLPITSNKMNEIQENMKNLLEAFSNKVLTDSVDAYKESKYSDCKCDKKSFFNFFKI